MCLIGVREWARTPFAEEGELLVAVLSVPTVQAPLVHVLDLEALKLGTEHVVLSGGRVLEVGQALRRQEHLHGAWAGGQEDRKPWASQLMQMQTLLTGSVEFQLFNTYDHCIYIKWPQQHTMTYMNRWRQIKFTPTFICHLPFAIQRMVPIGDDVLIAHPEPETQR